MSGITLKHFITFLGCMLLIFPLALAQQEGIYSATESEKLRLEREHDLFGSQDVPPIIRIFSAEHGWRSGKIVGGEDADIADFPWQVALMQGNTQFCAGSIIHKEWILTAAHCLTGGWNPDYIRAGVTNRTDNTGQDIDVDYYIAHPNHLAASPENLTVEASAMGALEVAVNWNNPGETVGGDTLTELDTISLFREGELIHQIDNPTIGDHETYTDTEVAESGMYSYAVIGENSHGEGLYACASVFVGEDLPGAPEDLELAAVDNEGLLSWNAPSQGLHEGYFDDSNLTYTIIRFPDGKEVAANISDETFMDTILPGIGNYYYEVTTSGYRKRNR